MIHITFRHGVGLDIEANEDICHRVAYNGDEDDEGVVCFIGTIIRIPLFTIYIGDFTPIEELADD